MVCFSASPELALPKQPLKRRHDKQYRLANRPCSDRCSDSAVCRKSGGERISSKNPNSLACSERPNCAEQRLPATQSNVHLASVTCSNEPCFVKQRKSVRGPCLRIRPINIL